MSDRTISRKAAIVGIGATEFSKASGRSELQLACEAVKTAIADAGLQPSDVDGLTTFTMDLNPEIDVAEGVGLGNLSWFSRTHYGGGASCASVAQAAAAVATGMAEVVVAYRAFNERSGNRFGTGRSEWAPSAEGVSWGWYLPHGFMTPAAWVAMVAQRYLHTYGHTPDDLGHVSVLARTYAATNPAAMMYRRPITLQDHHDSRWITEPLRLFDCCLETDGGQAIVVTTPQRARDLPNSPAIITAATQASPVGQRQMTSFYDDPMDSLPEQRLVARRLYEQSGFGPDDIDAANLYDAFSPLVLMQLEEYGFVKPGEAADFVADGHCNIDGRLPTNTNGGQMGEAYLHGMNGIAEAVRLVRGTSVNQPAKDCTNVLVTAGLGVPSSGLILSRDD
ncbi:MAG: acetyl-CoA acetyltransferase [Glaciecola sp.]|jgi:acetyl-CoA acetyltransferase